MQCFVWVSEQHSSHAEPCHACWQGLASESPAFQRAAAALEDYDFSKESTLEDRCQEAFGAVQHFEKTHCLALQVSPAGSAGW